MIRSQDRDGLKPTPESWMEEDALRHRPRQALPRRPRSRRHGPEQIRLARNLTSTTMQCEIRPRITLASKLSVS